MHGGNYLNGAVLASVHWPAVGLGINRVEVCFLLISRLFSAAEVLPLSLFLFLGRTFTYPSLPSVMSCSLSISL